MLSSETGKELSVLVQAGRVFGYFYVGSEDVHVINRLRRLFVLSVMSHTPQLPMNSITSLEYHPRVFPPLELRIRCMCFYPPVQWRKLCFQASNPSKYVSQDDMCRFACPVLFTCDCGGVYTVTGF